MQEVQLTFKCPININTLESEGKIKHCDICNKKVNDFSKTATLPQLNSNEKEPCGIFIAKQLHNPYGDFRDKFISFYQKSASKKQNSKSKFSLALALASCLLFITSCHHHQLTGAYACDSPVPPKTDKKLSKEAKKKNVDKKQQSKNDLY